MFLLARNNFKAHKKQYVATSIALIICCIFTVFVMATVNLLYWSLVNNNIYTKQTDLLISSDYAAGSDAETFDADKQAAVLQTIGSFWLGDIQEIKKQYPEVEYVGNYIDRFYNLQSKDAQLTSRISIVLSAPFYRPTLLLGDYPANDSEAIIGSTLAKSMNLKIGDTFKLTENDAEFKVSGVINEDILFKLGRVPTVYFHQDALPKLNDAYGIERNFDMLLIKVRNADVDALKGRLNSYFAANNMAEYIGAESVQEEIKQKESSYKGTLIILQIALYIFPLLASLFCIAVVSATFNVVFVRRTKEIGLLRCIGFSGKQIRKSILLECLIVGTLASLSGCILGIIFAIAVILSSGMITGLTEVLNLFNVWTFLCPFAVSLLITIFAGLRPSLRISKTPPLAALQEQTAGKKERRLHIVCRYLTALLFAAAATSIWIYIWPLRNVTEDFGVVQTVFLALILGGLLYMGAILLVGADIFPRLLALCCRPFKANPVVRLTAVNLLSNKKRSGATITTLLLSVVVVATLALGTLSISKTFEASAKRIYPIDLVVQVSNDDKTLAPAEVEKIVKLTDAENYVIGKSYRGITSFSDGTKDIDLPSYSKYHEFKDLRFSLLPENMGKVSRSGQLVNVPEDELWLSDISLLTKDLKDYDGKTLYVKYADGASSKFTLRIVKLPSYMLDRNYNLFVSPSRAKEFAANSLTEQPDNLMLSLPLEDNLIKLQKKLSILATQVSSNYYLDGSYFSFGYVRIFLATSLLILVTLSCVSALVSLVGIANNLSLSIIDRARDNALLRAVGLSSKQVKQMVVLEGFLMSSCSLVCGLIVSLIFTKYGISVLPFGSRFTDADRLVDLNLSFIFGFIALITVSCLLSTYLPAKRAASASPLAALSQAD